MIRAKLSGPDARFYAFAAFLVIVFFTGGGSRDDIQSLLLLRPLAVLFCAYALTVKVPDQWKGRMFPLYILWALALLMILQLIPLPPSVWTRLPERQIFADIADLMQIEQPWRPLTLSPSRTMNSLFSLAVPMAVIMLYLNLDREHRERTVAIIIVLCAISAFWAILQIVGPANGPFYTYRITNNGIGVGLFANRNHQAITLASAIVMLGWYAASLKSTNSQSPLKFYGSLATLLVLVPLIFVTGSRAGLLLMVPALGLALLFIFFGSRENQYKTEIRDRKSRQLSGRGFLLFSGIVLVAGISASSILLSRSLAFDRLFSDNDIEELRWQLLPTLSTMLRDYMPWGSGFGTFEHVYKIYEPQELLRPQYLNQAHNDWLQFLIEGGIPALLIALVTAIGFAMLIIQKAKNWSVSKSSNILFVMCVAIIFFMLATSIGDYPLRVPTIMAISAVLCCLLFDSNRRVQQRVMISQ